MNNRWLLAVVCLANCIVGAISQARADITSGLVAYYPFNGNANDESGNGNSGTVIGATLATNPLGVANSAYGFDGASNRIFIPDAPVFGLTNSLTLSAFVFAEPFSTAVADIIFRGDDRMEYDPYVLRLKGTNTLFFDIEDDYGNITAIQTPLSLNSWHQIVGVLDGAAGEMSIYIDGALVASDSCTIHPIGFLTGSNPGLGIGNLQSGGHYQEPFHGIIDDVRIYDRALSSSDVSQLFSVESVPEPSTLALVFVGLGSVIVFCRRVKSCQTHQHSC